MTAREEVELDFLRWFYHRSRVSSSDSANFEQRLSEIYKSERGGWFPYKLVDKPEVVQKSGN